MSAFQLNSLSHSLSRWVLFRLNFQHIVAAATIACLVMLVSRIASFWLMAPAEIFESYLSDIPSTLVYSLRWDYKIMSILYSIPFLLSILGLIHISLARIIFRFNHFLIYLLLIFVSLLSALNVFYWQAYGNPFDIFVFGLFEDDTTEVLKVIWSQYPLVWMSIIFLGLSWFLIKISRFLASSISHEFLNPKSKVKRGLKIIVIFIAMALLARNSFGIFPLDHRTTQASNLVFLNHLAINAPAHMAQAIEDHSKNAMDAPALSALTKRGYSTVDAAIEDLMFIGDTTEFGVPLLAKSGSTWTGAPPNIIFVLMESWSSQIVLDPNQYPGFLGAFQPHLDKGFLYENFLANRKGTNRFIESTIGNSSFFNLSISSASKMTFNHTNIQTLEALGFQTGFIRGGARSWYNQGNFWPNQGFDYYWDMADIMARFDVEKFSDWGVHDEWGFKFALERVDAFEQNEAPWFLFVETTTNHPPHLPPKGYDAGPIQLDNFDKEKLVHPDEAENQIKTVRYMTDQFGLFMDELEQRNILDNTIVVAVGDHTMWTFYNYKELEDKLYSSAVPLYMRLPPNLTPQYLDTSIAGSQRDIFPTLFELAYPEAVYLKAGFNLLDAHEFHGGWSDSGILTYDKMAVVKNTEKAYNFDENLLIDTSQFENDALFSEFYRHIQAQEALIEWQFRSEYHAQLE